VIKGSIRGFESRTFTLANWLSSQRACEAYRHSADPRNIAISARSSPEDGVKRLLTRANIEALSSFSNKMNRRSVEKRNRHARCGGIVEEVAS